jgi:hypothetical protein
MGINRQVLQTLLHENNYRPIKGKVLLIGRSTVTIRIESINNIFKQFNRTPPDFCVEALSQTKHANDAYNVDDIELIRSVSEGIESVDVLDVSSYEGANVIHDLNVGIPDGLECQYDFIYDSSVLDNIFSPAKGIENIYRMLAPRGRYLGLNVSSFYPGAFSSLSPEWFYSFFALNGCADVKVYLVVQTIAGDNRFEYLADLYRYQPSYTANPLYDHFKAVTESNSVCHTIVIAEKSSTSGLGVPVNFPVNLQYVVSSGAVNWAGRESTFRKSDRPVMSAGSVLPKRNDSLSFHHTDHYIYLGSSF